jgi:hypothetical protein
MDMTEGRHILRVWTSSNLTVNPSGSERTIFPENLILRIFWVGPNSK